MKNLLALLCVLAVIGTASAALIPNGDFDSGAAGWDLWWGPQPAGSVTASEEATGGNPGGYVQIDAGAGTWAGWYGGPDILLTWDQLGAPAGSTVVLQADIKSFDSNLLAAGLKIESVGGGTDLASEMSPGAGNSGVTTSWATYSVSLDTNPNNLGLVYNLMTIPEDAGGASIDGFDNAQLIVGGKALYPTPIDGAGTDPLITTELTWGVDPNSTASTTAYLLESDTPIVGDPNLGPVVFDFPGQTTELTVTGNSADVTGLLADDKYYYWAVHINDTIQGFVWNFQTADVPPTVDAGADQFLVTTGSGMVLSLDATVFDDLGNTISWVDITADGDKDPDTTVSDPNVNSTSTTVTLTNSVSGAVTGWYQFQITADDGVNAPVSDVVAVGVYPTCADAAAGDPDDGTVIVSDVDGNCKSDLADFALFASDWLGCNSNRVTCP